MKDEDGDSDDLDEGGCISFAGSLIWIWMIWKIWMIVMIWIIWMRMCVYLLCRVLDLYVNPAIDFVLLRHGDPTHPLDIT